MFLQFVTVSLRRDRQNLSLNLPVQQLPLSPRPLPHGKRAYRHPIVPGDHLSETRGKLGYSW